MRNRNGDHDDFLLKCNIVCKEHTVDLVLRFLHALLQCFSTGVPPKQTEIAWYEIRNHSSVQL